jgi:hypothetical protein
MALRDWSVRRIATMWLAVFVIEAGIIAVSAYRSREIRAEMRRTDRELGTSFVDSIPDSTSGIVVRRTNPRADSVLDSAMVLLGRVIADTGVQRTIAGAATGLGRAVTKSLILAALLLLPLPISASGVTLCWLWLRGRRDDQLVARSAA